MANVDLAEVSRRPQRYWNVDGLPELVMGLLWVVWGAAWLIGEWVPREGAGRLYWLFAPALLVLGGFGAIGVIKRLKARLTFPRTGFVEWREPSGRERTTAAAVALIIAMVLVLIVGRGGTSADHAAPVLGVILSLAFVVASLRQRAPHYLALAGVALATGLAFGAIEGGWTSANWLFVIVGLATAALGAIRLALFLRKHPRAEAAS